jgi:hypothetical protein
MTKEASENPESASDNKAREDLIRELSEGLTGIIEADVSTSACKHFCNLCGKPINGKMWLLEYKEDTASDDECESAVYCYLDNSCYQNIKDAINSRLCKTKFGLN